MQSQKFPKLLALLATGALAASLFITGCSSSSSKQETQATALRTDAKLAGEVQTRISSDPTLAANQRNSIGVNVRDGVATLSGWVSSDGELTAALNAAQSVDGVRQVVSRLQVGQEFAGMPGAAAAASYENQSARNQEAMEGRQQPNMSRKPAPSRATNTAAARPAARKTTPIYATNGGVSTSGSGPASTSVGANSQPYSAAGEPTYGSTSSASQSPYAGNSSASSVTAVAAPPVIQRVSIPAGTEVPVRLIDSMSSETSNRDQIWRGTVNGDIVVDDHVVIPSGADVEGRIVEVKKATNYTGAAQLTLQLSRVSFAGKSYTVASDQWTRKGAARGGNTAKKVGTGAAVGAVLGGIFGGGKGAAIGAAAGAGAGAGANTVTKGEKVELDSESLIMFRLQSSISVVPAAERERGYSAPRNYIPPDRNSDDDSRPVLKRRG